MCWLTKNANNDDTSIVTRVTAANTATFAHSIGRRFGTAASVERIMPLEYSPAMISTPSTPDRQLGQFEPGQAVG